jgi:DNA-binding MarR family transcriptional regulator
VSSDADVHHIGRLLRDALHTWEADLIARQNAAGLEGNRPRFAPVFRHLDGDRPSRLTYLAERSGLSRQAFAAVVDELERLGIVARIDSPEDPRVKLLTYTERGRQRFAAARRIMLEMEADYRARVGDEDWTVVREALRAIVDGGR